MSGSAIPAHARGRKSPIRYLAALVLLAITVFPFLCMTVPASAGMPPGMQPHAHGQVDGVRSLAKPVTDHGCSEFAAPQFSREGASGFDTATIAWRHTMPVVALLPFASPSVSNRDLWNRAMFQVYRL